LGGEGAMPDTKILEVVLEAVSAVIYAVMCILEFICYIGRMEPENG
jgi:hypothetical protein